jgi:NAD(P)-dependent dehydrogenase (short-subunit alcohol dehydrogenase family)
MATKQKTVIITGALQGIGAGAVQAFLDPLHKNNPRDFLKSLSPMGTISDVNDIADEVVYLTEARHVTGEVLHVDGGAHSGKW